MKTYTGQSKKRVVELETLDECCCGVLIEAKNGEIPKETIYLFPSRKGDNFHMRGVSFDLDIAFLNPKHKILAIRRMVAHGGTAKAPDETAFAVEAEAGFFDNYKIGEEFVP